MFWNKEKKQDVLAIIIGMDGNKEKMPQDENGNMKDSKDPDRACEGILKAIETRDHIGLKTYLKSFIESIKDDKEEDEIENKNEIEGSVDWVAEMKKGK